MATSAYQTEGAVDEDGRGRSIWDTFSHAPGRTRHGDTGDIACDHYRRFEDDVGLLSDLGVGAYRFSVAWPRIQPEGRGPANHRGLDHYRRLVGALRERGIAPVATLYHWDLPQALEDAGGWPERDTADRFADYAALVHEALAEDVALWITICEPWVVAWLGYGTGQHAPGRTDDALALAASHHTLLAHGKALEAMGDRGGPKGICLNLQPVRPASRDPDDERVAHLADGHMNRLFLDPLFGRGYPEDVISHYGSDMSFVRDGDLDTIATPMGFLGVNYYTRFAVTVRPPPGARAQPLAGNLGGWTYVPPQIETTAMGWGVEPSVLTDILTRVHDEYPPIDIYLTENGAAFDDYIDPEGAVDDTERIAFLREHILAAHVALEAGVPLAGYFVWSLMDNFEWAEGYGRRFGLVFVDYRTQERIPKASAGWLREVIARDRLEGSGRGGAAED